MFPCGKHEWPFEYNFQNSGFRCKNMNARLVAVFKILCFVIKKQMATTFPLIYTFNKDAYFSVADGRVFELLGSQTGIMTFLFFHAC